VTTGAGSECSIFTGFQVLAGGAQTPVGFSGQYCPTLRKTVVDLTTILNLSETITNETRVKMPEVMPTEEVSIRTNLAVAARVQIPKGMGIFFLTGASKAANSKRIGVVISAIQH
jgi:hypothetical protein